MHVHKAYPFHPIYWATECQFWPGFAPWKLHVEIEGAQHGPWNIVHADFEGVTDEGGTVPDATQIFWFTTVPTIFGDEQLSLSLEQITRGGIKYARWKALLGNFVSIDATAWLYLPFPQRVVDTSGHDWATTDVVVPVAPVVQIKCRPATFAEGGTPFPNY